MTLSWVWGDFAIASLAMATISLSDAPKESGAAAIY
jgi:hypothetical protein